MAILRHRRTIGPSFPYVATPSVVAVAAATQWNPADNTSNVTVTNVGRTVTYSGSGNQVAGCRSIAAMTSNQLVYIEHVPGTIAHAHVYGFANTAAAFNATSYDSSPAKAFALDGSGRFRDVDSADNLVTAIATWTAGDRIGIAFNSQTLKVWFRKNAGAWNSVIGGGQDPAAGTGGLNVVTTPAVYYAYFSWDADTVGGPDAVTTGFASTDWAFSAPTGYSQLSA